MLFPNVSSHLSLCLEYNMNNNVCDVFLITRLGSTDICSVFFILVKSIYFNRFTLQLHFFSRNYVRLYNFFDLK